MLRITAIQKAKKGGYHLFIEEEYALTISAEVLAETGLAVGQQITPQRLDEIRRYATGGVPESGRCICWKAAATAKKSCMISFAGQCRSKLPPM